MKVAIVTDFLNQFGGAEIVTHEIAKLFPRANIYTLMAQREVVDKYFPNHKVIQHFKMESSKLRRKYYRKLLPFYPTYIEDLDLGNYDLVISSSYLWSKGVLTKPETTHISYIHTPMRQAWIKYHEYLKNENDVGQISRQILRYVMNYMRLWDESSSKRVDYFIANSTTVQKRINKFYRRDAEIIFPPIRVNKLKKSSYNGKGEHYITVGRLVPYKRVDLLIKAFNEMQDKKLIILGDGNDKERLKKLIENDNIKMLGYVDKNKKNELVSRAKAFLFAAEEDFGMSPVEAMALGTPVVGYHKGGTRDYIKEDINGLYFYKQNVKNLINAINKFEVKNFEKSIIKNSVDQFDVTIFRNKMRKFISDKSNFKF